MKYSIHRQQQTRLMTAVPRWRDAAIAADNPVVDINHMAIKLFKRLTDLRQFLNDLLNM